MVGCRILLCVCVIVVPGVGGAIVHALSCAESWTLLVCRARCRARFLHADAVCRSQCRAGGSAQHPPVDSRQQRIHSTQQSRQYKYTTPTHHCDTHTSPPPPHHIHPPCNATIDSGAALLAVAAARNNKRVAAWSPDIPCKATAWRLGVYRGVYLCVICDVVPP